MVIFEWVEWKNILSFGNTPTKVILNKNKSTVIQGRNGAGKSTLLDVLCFVLFDKPFRKINKSDLVNRRNKKDLLVTIQFSIDSVKYKVVRGLNPKVFQIYKDDVLIDQDAATKDYQSYLETNILKFGFQSFTQLVILGRATYVSFLRLKLAERREFIEHMLKLNVFSAMSDYHKEQVSLLKKQISDNVNEIKLNNNSVELRKSFINSLKTSIDAQNKIRITKIEEAIALAYKEHDERESSILSMQAKLVEFNEDASNKNIKKYDKLKEIKSRLTAKMGMIKEDAAFFKNNDVCPTCKQPIDDVLKTDKLNSAESKIKEISDGLENLNDDISSVEDAIKHDASVYSNNTKLSNEIASLLKQNMDSKNRIKRLQLELKTDDTGSADKLEEETRELETLEKNRRALDSVRDSLYEKSIYYDVVTQMLKDSGIKSVIIKQYIHQINKFINDYLSRLGFFVKFVMDESFEDKIYSRGFDEMSYFNFSEGEKLRIDLSIMMAWRDVAQMQNNTSTNLLIFDETLDGCFDDSGAELFIELLESMYGTNVFVISHYSKWADRFTSTLSFDKVDGFSTIA